MTTGNRTHNTLLTGAILAVFALSCLTSHAGDAATKQKAFESPDAAFKALMDGFDKNSDDILLEILGNDNKDLVVQSDKAETERVRKKISGLAKEHMAVVMEGDKAVAQLGIKEWPYPIPVVKTAAGWVFDTASGKEEILNRRIGHNELSAIKLVDAYDDAQRQYASKDHTGDKVLKYAQKLISSKDKHDGLYWPAVANEDTSPLAALLDEQPDFTEGNGTDIPYHGYYFKILTKQGANPPNGKYDYVINGNMIAGFALVAWPADYGSSGIMTFVISHQGIIYQKDLGADTAKIAGAMDEYNPDNTWSEVKTSDK